MFVVFFKAHVVSAFEQSLAHMTARLQALTSGTEGKAAPPFASFPETQDFIQVWQLSIISTVESSQDGRFIITIR